MSKHSLWKTAARAIPVHVVTGDHVLRLMSDGCCYVRGSNSNERWLVELVASFRAKRSCRALALNTGEYYEFHLLVKIPSWLDNEGSE